MSIITLMTQAQYVVHRSSGALYNGGIFQTDLSIALYQIPLVEAFDIVWDFWGIGSGAGLCCFFRVELLLQRIA